MILIGMFDSPFVRRVAVSMNLLRVPFEHRNWSVGKDFELIRQFNPLGRVPALVQADGDTLIESAAILDFLDENAALGHALLPRSGEARREALRIMAIAVGGAEKAVAQIYETAFRPAEKRYRPWVERCHTQMHAALGTGPPVPGARRGVVDRESNYPGRRHGHLRLYLLERGTGHQSGCRDVSGVERGGGALRSAPRVPVGESRMGGAGRAVGDAAYRAILGQAPGTTRLTRNTQTGCLGLQYSDARRSPSQ